MINTNGIKVGDFVRFTDTAVKKYTNKKWVKSHQQFSDSLSKVLPINKFRVLHIDTDFAGFLNTPSIYLAGLFEWYIPPEDLELIPEEETSDESFLYLTANIDKYLSKISALKEKFNGRKSN